ncbi:MAG: glycoside hydrolase family 3 C-terminal domain-containing protein [Oscillospiraceae bacterium]|nr:glycoside hydrolase family 3 C-terminal domain-containing protein [Oscillospiraceae bacterium]
MFDYLNEHLPIKERVKDLLHQLTLEEKLNFLSTRQLPIERLNISEWLIGDEIARGLVSRDPQKYTTVFPQAIGMSATFDKKLLLQIGKTAGKEARAYYNLGEKTSGLMVWGPTVDLCHDPRWGRTEECYGEDPFLTGEMASMYTLGLRGDDPEIWATIPTLKHFCANSHEQDRDIDNANLNPRLKHEYYYQAFKKPVIKGGAHSVMTSYNEICHTPAVLNHDLKQVLKKDWGLGFVVTDAGDFIQNVTAHKIFHSHAESLSACLSAGADCMTDNETCVIAAARKALQTGLLSEADIDEAVSNILESHFLLGRFNQSSPYDDLQQNDINTEEDKALNLRAARENVILLDNHKNILPLNPQKMKKIGLFGCNADVNLKDWYTGYASYHVSVKKALEEKGFEVVYDSGWDIVKILAPNQKYVRIGEDDFLYADTDETHASAFYVCEHGREQDWDNFQEVQSGRFLKLENDFIKLGGKEVYGWFTSETFKLNYYGRKNGQLIYDHLEHKLVGLNEKQQLVCLKQARPSEQNLFFFRNENSYCARLFQLAKDCDAIIYCGGNDPMQVARECWDRDSIDLNATQINHLALLKDISLHQPFIFVLISSYPYAIPEGWADAVLWSSHAGSELGHAVADVLFGAYNPAGRCPLTWYACDEDLPDLKNYDIMKTKSTYRYFDGEALYPFGYGLSYSKFVYSDLKIQILETGVQVSCQVQNCSERDGDEVVQIYFHAKSTRIQRPDIQLCAFERIFIKAGETASFSQIIPFAEFEIYDVSREIFCLEEGDFDIFVGASSKDIKLSETIHIQGECIPPRNITLKTRAELYDTENNTEIFTNPLSGETYVKGTYWHNQLIFQNCQFLGNQSLTIWASSANFPATLYIFCGAEQQPVAEIALQISDGFEDFQAYTVPLKAEGCHHLRFAFGQDVCIKAFQISSI